MANAGSISSSVPLLVSRSSSSPAASTGTLLHPLLEALLVAFAWAFEAQQVFISAFTDASPPWHCLASSSATACSSSTTTTGALPPCALGPPGTSWAWDRPAEASVVSEWSLGCGGPAASFLVSLPASSFFAGCLAGGFVLAALADSLVGRRTLLLVSLACMSASGAVTAAAPNVWAYAALRLVSGFFRSAVGASVQVLATELVGDSGQRRNTVSVAAFASFAFGFLSLPALAYALRDASWRTMYLCTSLPCLAYTLLLFFVVPESPRWLLLHQQQQQLEKLDAMAADKHEGEGAFGALQAMWARRWACRRLAAVTVAGFGVGMVYFGMPLNLGGLGLSLYVSAACNALAELASAALTWLLLAGGRRIDRRNLLVALTVAAGGSSLAAACVPAAAPALPRVAAELLCFLATCVAFDVLLVYTAEMFPTSVRNSAVGMVRQAAVLGAVAAPVLVALGRQGGSSFWSFGVFGVVIGCCGVFIPCLPETRGGRMSDTMDEEEERNGDLPPPSSTGDVIT